MPIILRGEIMQFIKKPTALICLLTIILSLLTACGSKNTDNTSSRPAPTLDLSTHKKINFQFSNENILNPERGTHASLLLTKETSMEWYASRGLRLFTDNLDLSPYRNSPIPNEYLEKVSRGLNAARQAGIKMIFRASYNRRIGGADAPLERVLEHIEQFQPIFEDNQDVISVVQAGFVGAWGEWHNSSHNLTEQEAKISIRNALLDAVPDSRMVQFRYPKDIISWYPDAVTATQAFTKTRQSRIGLHNDCFIADVNDTGTYTTGKIEEEKSYHAAVAPHVAIGGETCNVNLDTNKSYRSCENALESMSRFQYSYMSDTPDNRTNNILRAEGCWDDIEKNLGYRYKMTSAQIPVSSTSGQELTAQVVISNDGFAALYNERPVYLVLEGASRHNILIETDPRLWKSGESTTLDIQGILPNNLPSGPYTVALWMPDASLSLQGNSRYSIQTANTGTWDVEKGYNIIGDIEITAP